MYSSLLNKQKKFALVTCLLLVIFTTGIKAQSCFIEPIATCCNNINVSITPNISMQGNQVLVNFIPTISTSNTSPCRSFITGVTFDYGDGSPNSNALSSPFAFSHTYTLSNACSVTTYTIKVCLNSTGDPSDEYTCVKDYILTIPPVGNNLVITATNTGCKTFSFSYSGVGTLNNVQWAFGDASLSPIITTGTTGISHTYPSSGSYVISLTAEGFSACPAYAQVTAIDIVSPDFSYTVNNVCDPLSGITLSIPGYTNSLFYQWQINNLIVPSLGQSATYTNNLSVGTNTVKLLISAGNCNTSVSKLIQIGTPSPNFTVNSQSLCAGDVLSVIGVNSGGDSYTWNIKKPDNTFDTPLIGMNPNYMFTFPGTYTISLTILNTYTVGNTVTTCTSVSPPVTVSVNAIPNAMFAILPQLCNGSVSLNIPTSTFTSYTLDYGNATIYNGTNVIPPNQAGNIYTLNSVYTISLSLNNNGCTSDYNTNVNINGLTTLALITPVEYLCAGATANITSVLTGVPINAGVVSYTWTGPNAFTSNQPSILINIGGTYQLNVSSNGVCPINLNAVKTITALAAPVATLISVAPLPCASLVTSAIIEISVELQQQGFYINNVLYPAVPFPAGPLNVTVNNLVEGVNNISIKNALDQTCSSGIGVNVIRNNPPLTVNVTNPAGCAANNFGSAIAVAGPPGGTISWYSPQGYNTTAFATGANSGNILPGTYIAEVVNGYCKTTNYFSITPPSINLSKSGPLGTCPNQSVNITANTVFIPNNINSALTYSWLKVSGNTSTLVATGANNIQNLGAGNYVLNVTAVNNCSATLAFNILQYSPVSIDFNIIEPACNQSGYVQANVSGGDGNYSYLWYENAALSTSVTGSTYDLNSIIAPLTLSLTVNDGSNCTASSPTPALSFNPPVPVTLLNCSGIGNTSATNINGCNISTCLQGGTAPYLFEWYKVVNKHKIIQWHFYTNGSQLIGDNGTQTVVVAVPANSVALASSITALNVTDSLATTVMYPAWFFPVFGPAVPMLNSFGTSVFLSSTASSTDIAHYYTVTEPIKLTNQEVFTAAYSGPSAQQYSNADFTDGIYKLYVTDAKGCKYAFNIGELTFPKPITFPVTFSYVWGMKPVQVPPTIVDNNFQDDMVDAANEISDDLGACLQKQTKALKTALDTTCSSLTQLKDELQVKFDITEHHYTLYYYDRAGQLTKTVPPQGVELLSVNDINAIKTKRTTGVGPSLIVNPHRLTTTYNYNSFGQLLGQNTPDGGSSTFIYDSKNRLRFSQNAKQLVAVPPVYSYTKYDELGRIIEVGESSNIGTLNFATPAIPANLAIADNTVYPQTNNKEITTTAYTQITAITYYGKPQQFTQNRVSYSTIDPDPTVIGDEHSTYYSYDTHGNVEWLVQDQPGGIGKNYIAYDYDLVSGKVLQVTYNNMREDRFFHRYQYDAENRLTNVQTSRDGLMWDNDANYQYYAHGPLKRQVIGEDHVQGLDYIYTINGWIKSINSPSLSANNDPGGDNTIGGPNGPGVLPQQKVANDRNGMVLNYYNGDYNSNSTNFLTANSPVYGLTSYSAGNAPSLYNGNISSWVQSQLNTISTTPILPRADLYKYDLLNRIKQSTSLQYDNTSITGWNSITGNSPGNAINTFKTTYDYDANGNILNLKRFDENGIQMDNLDYTYDNGVGGTANLKNRLTQVTDNENTNVLLGRGDLESTHTYGYDAIGNMTLEVGPERLTINAIPGLYSTNTKIDWTVYGKIRQVKKDITGPSSVSYKEEINFAYDASGNRVKKEYWKDAQPTLNGLKDSKEITTTYYVRDAQGNVMGTYKKHFDITDNKFKIDLIDEAIYGSDRIGQNSHKITLQSATNINALLTPTNGVAVTSEYQNWITAANKTGSITPSGFGDLCQCKIVSMSNPVVTGGYNNATTVTDFLGIANNGVAVAEDLSGNLQFYVVLAKKYLGVNDVCLVYDKNGKLMQGSQNIGQIDPQSKPIIINLPNSNKYAVATLGVDKQVKYHIVDMNEIGYAPVGNSGKVINTNLTLPATSGSTTAYGYHFTGVENHMENKAILYASRYTPNITNTLTGTTEIVGYEFTGNNAQPTEYILYNMSGCGSTEAGQLQLSPNGNKLAWYQHDKNISGFKMREGYLYTMPLSANKTAVNGAVDIHPISTAGNYGNGALEFMTNNNDLLYSQYGVYKQNSNAGTKYDRNIWKYDPVNLTDISINPNPFNPTPLVTYLLGEIKRGNDGNYYIPNLAEPATNNIHSYDGSLWNNGINSALTSYSYAASWPTQVWKLYADQTQTLSAYTRYIGDKQYELKDHLGNVKTVISDEKLITDLNTNDLVDNNDSYDPKILNYNDYYAFGAPMPGRSYFSSDPYRYGMNGQENDDEITGNRGTHTSAEYWEYDTRLGRRWNIDPIVKPWEAPYACFNNNPILFADPKGLDGEDRAKKYAAKNGGTVSKGSNGKSYVDGLSAGEGEYGTASKEFGDRWYEKAGKSIGNFFSKAADVVSNGDFKASVTGKVTFGIQAKLQAGMGKYLGAEINLNLAKVDIVKSNLNLSKPNKGDWSYKSDWNHVGENGGAHISQDARLGLDIAQYPVLEGYYKNDFDLDGLNAVEGSTKSNYGVSVVVPLIKKKTASDVEMMTVTDAAKAMGYMKNPAMKNPKSIQGEKEFYGIDVGAGAALFLGVDLNIKIGFESK